MNLIELSRALHQLRLGGMVAVLETRLLQAQTENMAPIDILSILVSDEIDLPQQAAAGTAPETGSLRVFSAELRRSEAVTLGDPVMPVFDGLGS